MHTGITRKPTIKTALAFAFFLYGATAVSIGGKAFWRTSRAGAIEVLIQEHRGIELTEWSRAPRTRTGRHHSSAGINDAVARRQVPVDSRKIPCSATSAQRLDQNDSSARMKTDVSRICR